MKKIKKVHPLVSVYKIVTKPLMMILLGMSGASILFLFATTFMYPMVTISAMTQGLLTLIAAIAPTSYILLLKYNIKKMFEKKVLGRK